MAWIRQVSDQFFTGTAANTLSVNVNAVPAVGNILLGAVKKSGVGTTMTSISDPRGNVWTIDDDCTNTSVGPGLYLCSTIVQNAYTINDTITVHYSTTMTDTGMIISEFSNQAFGAPASFIPNGYAGSNATTSSVTNISSTTSQASSAIGDLMWTGAAIGGAATNHTWTIPPTYFTGQPTSTAGDPLYAAYGPTLVAGSTFSANWSWTTAETASTGILLYFPVGTRTTTITSQSYITAQDDSVNLPASGAG